MREWFEQYEGQFLDDFGRRAMPGIGQAETLLRQYLAPATWAVRRFPRAPYDLLVGDNPLIQENEASGAYLYPLPIAPRCLFLVVSDARLLGPVFDMPEREIVRRVNLEMLHRAERYVYATSRAQMRIVGNHWQRGGPTSRDRVAPQLPAPHELPRNCQNSAFRAPGGQKGQHALTC